MNSGGDFCRIVIKELDKTKRNDGDHQEINNAKTFIILQVLIDNHRAVGVTFDLRGKEHSVTAKREVIVSAGAIKTPQLLMLSGIGPKKELEAFGVRCFKLFYNET